MARRIFLLLTACVLLSLPCAAQVGQYRNRIDVGVSAGINLDKASFSPSVKQKNMLGMDMGVVGRYITERWFGIICGLKVEVNFSQRGWSEYYEDYPDLKYQSKMNYVEIPFLMHMGFGKEDKLQLYLNAGPQIGFFLSESYSQSGDWDSVSYVQEQHGKSVEQKFDYGISGGLGVEYPTKVGNFFVEGRYFLGLGNFYKTTKKDYFSRAAHTFFTIKAGYLFTVMNKR